MANSKPQLSIGIDPGTYSFKAAYFDGKTPRLIAALNNNSSFNVLREECEIFFDDFVSACVIAVPPGYSQVQQEEITAKAKLSGFDSVRLISSFEAMAAGLENPDRTLVLNLGKSWAGITVFKGASVIENVILDDVSGDCFNKFFSEWLAERLLLDVVSVGLLNEAEKIKIALSERDFVEWDFKTRGTIKIFREDFERLIRFPIRKAIHSLNRLNGEYKPENVIVTGGSFNIPFVKSTVTQAMKAVKGQQSKQKYINDLIVRGAAIKAGGNFTQSSSTSRSASKIKELRASMIELEDFLTRSQKDRLYVLFKKAEAHNSVISMLENLLHELMEQTKTRPF